MKRISDLKPTSAKVITDKGVQTLKSVDVTLTHAEVHSIIHALAEKERRNATDDILLKDASEIDEYFENEFKAADEAQSIGG